jgi:hypothetical protein
MSAPDHSEITGALSALLAKLGPGIAGAIISLKFIPIGTSWGARFMSLAGGVAAAVYLAPALGEWLGVASARIEAGMGFLVGSLAMVVLGEATQAVHEAQVGQAVRGWLRKRAGLE